jgi:thymidylate synthase
LETGKLIFHSKNCHIYQRQNKLVEELLKPKTSDKKPRIAQTIMGASEEAAKEK